MSPSDVATQQALTAATVEKISVLLASIKDAADASADGAAFATALRTLLRG